MKRITFLKNIAAWLSLPVLIRFSGYKRNLERKIEFAQSELTEHTEKQGIVLYRDAGEWQALSKRCTHLGCTVHFNSELRQYECPCHGSRYAADGKVINGPATQPLKKLPLSEKDGRIIVTERIGG